MADEGWVSTASEKRGLSEGQMWSTGRQSSARMEGLGQCVRMHKAHACP